MTGRRASNDLGLRHRAVLAGLGIGMLPLPLVHSAIQGGTLQAVLPGQLGSRTSMSVGFVERAFMLPKVRAFVDHVVSACAGPLPDALLPVVARSGRDAS